jgi:hypothetical protein
MDAWDAVCRMPAGIRLTAQFVYGRAGLNVDFSSIDDLSHTSIRNELSMPRAPFVIPNGFSGYMNLFLQISVMDVKI